MKVGIINIEGVDTGKSVDLDSNIFGIDSNDHAIYLDVKHYLANQRQGTSKTKNKWEVNYSTRKIKRQKGTGTARAGSIKSGVMVGGGRIHGPQPRDYDFKLNKKLKTLARKSALSTKAKENGIIVIENFNFEKPNTKQFNQMLNKIGVLGNRTLIVTPEYNKNIYLSGRNIVKTEINIASDLSTYQILKAKKIIFTLDALTTLNQFYNN